MDGARSGPGGRVARTRRGLRRRRRRRASDAGSADAGAAPAASAPASAPASGGQDLAASAKAIFGVLPADASVASNPTTAERVELGRTLYFDPRLSKNHDVSCNSCHMLDRFGVDGEPTSAGHKGQRGDRNSPTVLNAALHIAQFWDGRAGDVEAQAKGPVLNPIEMALPSAEAAETVLRSIPGYAPMFAAAFPGEEQPITFDNMALAIGAFERKLITPAPIDAFIAGDSSALSEVAQQGFETFVATGCPTCHAGPAIGGAMYQKLGLVEPYPTEDPGRMAHTGNEADRGFFKVPSLRNIAETGPYFHDGSIEQLEEAVRIMAKHQLGKTLDDTQVRNIVTFLESLTGEVPAALAAAPSLPPSSPTTPAPDPS